MTLLENKNTIKRLTTASIKDSDKSSDPKYTFTEISPAHFTGDSM